MCCAVVQILPSFFNPHNKKSTVLVYFASASYYLLYKIELDVTVMNIYKY